MRMVLYAPNGIPELDIPAGSVVTWYPFERRYAVTVERGYDHGVLLNQLEMGTIEDVTPSTSSEERQERRRAVASLRWQCPRRESDRAPRPPQAPLRLVP